MRNFIETKTHRQCCASRCKKMVRKGKDENNMKDVIDMFGGSLASLCTKHTRESLQRHEKSLKK